MFQLFQSPFSTTQAGVFFDHFYILICHPLPRVSNACLQLAAHHMAVGQHQWCLFGVGAPPTFSLF